MNKSDCYPACSQRSQHSRTIRPSPALTSHEALSVVKRSCASIRCSSTLKVNVWGDHSLDLVAAGDHVLGKRLAVCAWIRRAYRCVSSAARKEKSEHQSAGQNLWKRRAKNALGNRCAIPTFPQLQQQQA